MIPSFPLLLDLYVWNITTVGVQVGVAQSIDDVGAFAEAMKVHRRVMPLPLPASWWVSTHDVIDATSVYLSCAAGSACALLRRHARYPSGLSESAHMWLTVAIDMVTMNREAGLTGRERMNPMFLYQSLGLVETAARCESQQSLLLESGVVDALEYTCVNDCVMNGSSLAASAAGGAVALLGRNEDGSNGKTLSRDSVFAVIDSVAMCFDKGSYHSDRPMAYVISNFARVATMCISDSNKRFMLEHSGLVHVLLHCLVIDDANPRKGQDGTHALQESCAGVFQELALFAPGATLLRSHAGALGALRSVAQEGSKKSKECAAAALFELEHDKRNERLQRHAGAGGMGTEKQLSPPHHSSKLYQLVV